MLLYVEDNALMQMLGEAVLQSAGYEVMVAKDGESALGRLRTRSKSLRALLTDINLGSGIDGWELSRCARRIRSGLPVVYLSGGTEEEWLAEGVPGCVLVVKPFVREDLLAVVAKVTQSRPA